MNKLKRQITLLALIITTFAFSASAQTTAFTYQGRFTDSSVSQPTNGTYTMTFRLFDAETGGNQIPNSATAVTSMVSVVNNIFTVRLDFGAAAFNPALTTSSARYLEIQIGSTILIPRQEITSTPTAQRALNASNADRLGGVAANQFVQTTDARLSDARTPTAGSANYIQNGTTLQTLSNFNISGNGTADSLAIRGGGTGLTLNNNFLRLKAGNDNNHGIVYNSTIDGMEFRANIGYRWVNGTNGATQRMSLDGSGNLAVGNTVTGNRFLARGGAPGGSGVNNNGYAFSGNSGDNDSGLFSEADGRVSLFSDSLERLRVEGEDTTVTGNLAVSGTISGTLANDSVGTAQVVNGSLRVGDMAVINQLLTAPAFTVNAHNCTPLALTGGGEVGDLVTVFLLDNAPAGLYIQPNLVTSTGNIKINVCNTLNTNITFTAQNVRIVVTRP